MGCTFHCLIPHYHRLGKFLNWVDEYWTSCRWKLILTWALNSLEKPVRKSVALLVKVFQITLCLFISLVRYIGVAKQSFEQEYVLSTAHWEVNLVGIAMFTVHKTGWKQEIPFTPAWQCKFPGYNRFEMFEKTHKIYVPSSAIFFS